MILFGGTVEGTISVIMSGPGGAPKSRFSLIQKRRYRKEQIKTILRFANETQGQTCLFKTIDQSS